MSPSTWKTPLFRLLALTLLPKPPRSIIARLVWPCHKKRRLCVCHSFVSRRHISDQLHAALRSFRCTPCWKMVRTPAELAPLTQHAEQLVNCKHASCSTWSCLGTDSEFALYHYPWHTPSHANKGSHLAYMSTKAGQCHYASGIVVIKWWEAFLKLKDTTGDLNCLHDAGTAGGWPLCFLSRAVVKLFTAVAMSSSARRRMPLRRMSGGHNSGGTAMAAAALSPGADATASPVIALLRQQWGNSHKGTLLSEHTAACQRSSLCCSWFLSGQREGVPILEAWHHHS